MKKSVGIIGVTGYAGQELLKILLHHGEISVSYLAARQLASAQPLEKLLPAFQGLCDETIHPFKLEEALRRCEILFLSLPHGIAMGLAPKILKRPGTRVIDLSGDFRLKSARAYVQAYGLRHASPELLKQSVYGLSEWARQEIRGSRLLANPGCYPTATLLGILPLARAGLLAVEGLVVDAKSGTTGAGRSATEELLFSEVNENLRAYKVDNHQHIPEMEQELSVVGRRKISMTFVPHLVPMSRGIYATCYAPLKKSVSPKQLQALYEEAYGKEPFIGLLPDGVFPQVRSVAGTNFCQIGLSISRNKKQAVIGVAIDNLGKGAAGQAVQNMNLLCGWPETTALLPATAP